MGFAINPSLNHLDVPEKYIIEIYQSASEIVLPDARFRGHPCEAYICIAKVDKDMKAYVALLNTALKSTLVYTSDFVARTPQDYPRVLAEAESFVTAMGFSLQKINLEFSPAMREVIIKGLRVMRPPAPQKRTLTRQPKIDVPNELVASTGLNEALAGEAGGDGTGMTELLSLKAELASARAALERVTREKVAAEQHNAGERGALKAACEQALESKRVAEERLAQAVRQLKKLEQGTSQQQDPGELQRLQQQLGTAAAGVAAADKAREQLQQELQGERQKRARLSDEKAQLEKRLAAELQKLSALQAEAVERQRLLEQQLADARSAGVESAAKLATLAGVEQSLRETQQREEELRRRSAAAEIELATARGDLEDLRHRLEQADELRQRLSLAEAELITVRQELSDLAASRNLTEETRENLVAVTAELAASREQLAASAAEIERLRQEQDHARALQQRTEATSDELATLQQELAAARDEIKQLTAAPPLQPSGEVTDEGLARLVAEKEAVEAEYVRLATESRGREEELSESLSQATAEVERLTSELEIQGQVAAMEQAALRAELRRMIVEGGAAFYPSPAAAEPVPVAQVVQQTAVAPTTPQSPPPPAAAAKAPAPPPPEPPIEELLPETEEEEDETPDAPITADIAVLQEFTSDLGGFYSGGGTSATEFRIDPAIGSIDYSDPAEVIAVFYSSNSVQAVPDGKGIQRCKGYIVATRASGTYRVYVAWYLTESGRVVICLPEQQPADSEECVLILKDAVSYFEIVGFMMEVSDLGSTRQSYRKALQKIPVLKKVATPG